METARKTDELIAQQEAAFAAGIKVVAEERPKARIALPQDKIGLVVGPKGANINRIKEMTGVERIDTQGGFCTLEGDEEAVAKASKAVNDLINKGYTEIQFDDFSEQFVTTVASNFPELIGPKGSIVRGIKEACGVEIQFPPTEPKGVGKGQPEKKVKIAVAGPKEGVNSAVAAMKEILAVHHSEITHPGEIHQEVAIKPWAFSYIIGTKGSELRHIQSNFKVRVFIPRGNDEDPVLVVGIQQNVDRAVKYIEKVVDAAENRPTGPNRGGDGYTGDDGWEQDEDHEPWMDHYLYKRK